MAINCAVCNTADTLSRLHPKNFASVCQETFGKSEVLLCKNCGFGQISPEPSPQSLSDFYNNIYSNQYNPQLIDILHPETFSKRYFSQIHFISNFIKLHDGIKVLEVGPNAISSLPSYSLYCKPQYFYFEQFDSPIISQYKGKRVGSYADANSIGQNFKEELDIVHTSHSFEHILPSQLNSMVDAVYKSLKQGGYFFIEVPLEENPELFIAPHTSFFTPDSLSLILKNHGFNIITLATNSHLFQEDYRWIPRSQKEKNIIMPVGQSLVTRRLKNRVARLLFSLPILGKQYKQHRLNKYLIQNLKEASALTEELPYLRIIVRK